MMTGTCSSCGAVRWHALLLQYDVALARLQGLYFSNQAIAATAAQSVLYLMFLLLAVGTLIDNLK
jgi:cell division protein FtsX